jgi:hypothetical protein
MTAAAAATNPPIRGHHSRSVCLWGSAEAVAELSNYLRNGRTGAEQIANTGSASRFSLAPAQSVQFRLLQTWPNGCALTLGPQTQGGFIPIVTGKYCPYGLLDAFADLRRAEMEGLEWKDAH